jgi:hypothetical protein
MTLHPHLSGVEIEPKPNPWILLLSLESFKRKNGFAPAFVGCETQIDQPTGLIVARLVTHRCEIAPAASNEDSNPRV